MERRQVRVLIAKPGLDTHDIGAKFVARSLRDAGMEVIYLGPFQTAERIVKAAVEEDVDVVGISTLSGEYLSYVPEVLRLLRARDMAHVLVLVGGLVLPSDAPKLRAMGVHGIFGPDTPMETVIGLINEKLVSPISSS